MTTMMKNMNSTITTSVINAFMEGINTGANKTPYGLGSVDMQGFKITGLPRIYTFYMKGNNILHVEFLGEEGGFEANVQTKEVTKVW